MGSEGTGVWWCSLIFFSGGLPHSSPQWLLVNNIATKTAAGSLFCVLSGVSAAADFQLTGAKGGLFKFSLVVVQWLRGV